MPEDYAQFDSYDSDGESINISPLIDVIFILLLFFVVTSVFVEESGLVIDKPESEQAAPIDDEPATISVTSAHEIYVADQRVGLRDLREQIREVRGRTVVIRADGAVRTDFLLKVMDEVKAAGARDIAIAAERPDS